MALTDVNYANRVSIDAIDRAVDIDPCELILIEIKAALRLIAARSHGASSAYLGSAHL